jgi:hypothetical protein
MPVNAVNLQTVAFLSNLTTYLTFQIFPLSVPTRFLPPVVGPIQAHADTMAVNEGQCPVPLEQLTTKIDPHLHHKPMSDTELVKFYCSIYICDKLARIIAILDPDTCH